MASSVPSEAICGSSEIVPLLSIEFQQPPTRRKRSVRGKKVKKTTSTESDPNSVIPALMSLSLNVPIQRESRLPATAKSTANAVHPPEATKSFDIPVQPTKSFVQPLLMTEPRPVDGLVPLLRRGVERVEIKEVERSNKTRREFALVARDVTREYFEPPAGSRILFAYYTYPSGKKVRGWFKTRLADLLSLTLTLSLSLSLSLSHFCKSIIPFVRHDQFRSTCPLVCEIWAQS